MIQIEGRRGGEKEKKWRIRGVRLKYATHILLQRNSKEE